MGTLLLTINILILPVIFAATSNVVVFSNGSISTFSLDFNCTAKYKTSKSFGIECHISSNIIITRCISWLFYAKPNKTKINTEFWKYSTNQIISQINISTPIYVSDGISSGRRNQKTIVWFKNIKTNINPIWDVLCSASPNTLDELKNNPSTSIFINATRPYNVPITLPISGAGFLDNNPPKFIFSTPDRLDISVDVIKGEFIRCIVAKDIEFKPFTDCERFWQLTNPKSDDNEYGLYSIGDYNPPLLGANMYKPREDSRHTITIKVGNLTMATRYTASCATSTLPPTQTTFDDSSMILGVVPTYHSTRGNSEAILSVYPNYVVANEQTLLHLNTHIIGDNFYKMVGFTNKICDTNSIISPSYLQYKSSKVYVLFNLKHLGKLMICYSGDGGETFWLQDNKDAVLDITATSRHSITAIIPTWSILGERTIFELKSRNNVSIIGDGWSKKIGLSLDECDNIIMDEYILSNKNEIIFTLQTFNTFDICYSEDYGKYWTLQITSHLSITGYSTKLGASNAKLKYIKLNGVELNRPFHPDILHYKGILSHILKDIHIEYETFEPKSLLNIFRNNKEIYFENNHKIPIHPDHIVDNTLIKFIVTAPDKITKQEYEINILRSANWDENIIKNIVPQSILSNIDTIWTLYPAVNGDNKMIRIGFVYDNEKSDCRLPIVSFPINQYSQFKGKIIWNYYGIGKFRICYSINGGKMWHKQKSNKAVIHVDGSYLRTPFHIASVVWVAMFLFMQWYCGRLNKLSKQNNSTN